MELTGAAVAARKDRTMTRRGSVRVERWVRLRLSLLIDVVDGCEKEPGTSLLENETNWISADVAENLVEDSFVRALLLES